MKTKSEIRAKKAMLKEKNSIRAIKPKVIKFSKRLLKKECDTVFSMYIRHIRDKDK